MDEFTKEMEEILSKEREILLSKLKAEQDDIASNSVESGDDGDISSSVESFQIKTQENALDARRIKSIENALKRIKNGRYGYCVSCGRKIPEGRLRALPSAVLCIECKEKQERALA